MSKFDEKLAVYQADNVSLGLGIDADLLAKVTKALGPSIYLEDASRVSGTDPEEVARVKNNYCIKKLGLTDSKELDAAVVEAINKLGSSNRNKWRALVYALICIKFGKQGIYA
jgi:hypothetical protein